MEILSEIDPNNTIYKVQSIEILSFLSNSYYYQYNYPKAIEYILACLKYSEEVY